MPVKKIALTGQRFGRLTVIEEAGRDKSGAVTWRCACECGASAVKRGADIARGKVKSCGCAAKQTRRADLTGQTFGRLTVVREAAPINGRGAWLCVCSCGRETVTRDDQLKSGGSASCGCATPVGKTTHGQSGTPLYRRWAAMINRTTNPNGSDYESYGGRGITVCSEWRGSFEAFARDMGPTFSPELTLDRIDPDGNYEPSNCRWLTNAEQQRNKRGTVVLTFRGQTMPLVEWTELLGLKYDTVHGRVTDAGWSVERALTTGADPVALASLDAEAAGKDIPVWDGSTRPATGARCPAAHPADPTPCDGPVVVTVLDAGNEGASGCEWHGARILASLIGGRVYALPDAPEGAAIRVFRAAGTLRPFEWLQQRGDR